MHSTIDLSARSAEHGTGLRLRVRVRVRARLRVRVRASRARVRVRVWVRVRVRRGAHRMRSLACINVSTTYLVTAGRCTKCLLSHT